MPISSGDDMLVVDSVCNDMCSLFGRDTVFVFFFFQAEDGIRDLVRSRGLGDVYKRQSQGRSKHVSSA